MIIYFIKGMLIGIIFGIPVGAVGVITIKRGILYGATAALLSGIGCSVADLFYSCISIFSFTLISDVMFQYQNIICIIGGILIIIIGISNIAKKQELVYQKASTSKMISFFTSSFLIAITNPATILSFLIAFSIFDIVAILNKTQGIALMVGIFFGTCIWWLAIAILIQMFRQRITSICLKHINNIVGMLIILFGIVIIVRIVI